jgi:hypothetical protein
MCHRRRYRNKWCCGVLERKVVTLGPKRSNGRVHWGVKVWRLRRCYACRLLDLEYEDRPIFESSVTVYQSIMRWRPRWLESSGRRLSEPQVWQQRVVHPVKKRTDFNSTGCSLSCLQNSTLTSKLGKTLTSIERCLVQISLENIIVTEDFCGVHQVLLLISRIMLQIQSPSLPFTYFSINFLLTVLPVEAHYLTYWQNC